MQRLLFAIATGLVALGIVLDSPAQRARQEVALRPQPLVFAQDAKTPIRLERAEVEVETIGSTARTTLLLTLHNPNDRLLEGKLEFPLQPGQQVAGFALDIDGVMRDAVPVPKEQGRAVFESIERRNVDPALLEQVAGNHFRLRVYPIPAHGTRQVRLVIDETMRRVDDAWALQLPLELLDGASQFRLNIHAQGVPDYPKVVGGFRKFGFERVGDGYEAVVNATDFHAQLGASLRFPAAAQAQSFIALHEGERYVLAEIPVASASRPRAMPHGIGLLWDASASARKRDRAGEFALLDRYFAAMGEGRVRLRLLRDTGEDGGEFGIHGGDWSALRKALENAVQDGASNLADWTPQAGIDEYLLVSDGLHNYGDAAFPALRTGQRLYAIASNGAQADHGRLAALAEARGGRLVAWQGRDGLDGAAHALLQDGLRVAELRGDGVTELVAQSRFVDDGILRVAGRLTEPTGTLHVQLASTGAPRSIAVPVSSSGESRPQAAQAWATWQVAALNAEPELHRAAIERLGKQFSLVTANTSLLVLDDPADYVRYDIPAPPALQAQVAALRTTRLREREASRSERLDKVAGEFADRLAWWERVFPKGAPPVAKPEDREDELARASGAVPPPPEEPPVVFDAPSPVDTSAPPPAPPLPARRRAPGNAATLDSIAVTGAAADAAPSTEAAGQGVTIRLQPWQPDSPFARRLREAKPEQVYALYLDERDSHAGSTAFYLDVADILLKHERRTEALRVLSNLAELELENRHVLRVLGYRLAQAGDWKRAVMVFRQVLAMAEEEPQSHRDLALALAAAGERQQAIRHLYDVVAGQWDGRFAEIELVALNELNQIVATSPKPLDTSFIDRRLLRNMPLDLRVALAWDSDNSDMDLWVTDPNGEKCYYGHKLTYQGGLISDDFTGGYGPEEFVLRDAKPGKYRVEAHYFGDRQQVVTGATTLSLRLSTGWGTPRQKDETVTLRLSGKDESVLVGEFEVE